MTFYEDILVEDWQGLESETERLLLVYGYPVSDRIESPSETEAFRPKEETGQASHDRVAEENVKNKKEP